MSAGMDGTERLLWTLMRRFEALALDRYEQTAPRLSTVKKVELVSALRAAAPDDRELSGSDLAAPVEALMATARGATEADTLLLQGLLLEPLGRAIYRAALASSALSAPGRALAELGLAAASDTCERAPALIEELLGAGEPLFAFFAGSTKPVLAQLDNIGERLDACFGERLQIRFADLVGEVASELLPACTALGMNRRKVVCHLTSALMGAA